LPDDGKPDADTTVIDVTAPLVMAAESVVYPGFSAAELTLTASVRVWR